MHRRQVLIHLATVIGSTCVAASAQAKVTATIRQIALTISPGKGKAKYKEDRGKREFEVELEGTNVPVRTVLTVNVGNTAVGTMTVVRVAGKNRAKLERSTKLGHSVPTIVPGSTVTVLNGATTVANGTF
jgi:hypothetical protein